MGSEESESETEDMKEIREMASKIRVKKKIMKVDARIDGGVKRQPLPRTSTAAKRSRSVARLKGEFTELGVDMTGTEQANFTKTRGRSTSKAAAKRSRMDVDGDEGAENGSVSRSKSRNRSNSRVTPRGKSGVRDPEQRKKIKKMEKKVQKKTFGNMGKAGESDRHIGVKMPKHLFAGNGRWAKQTGDNNNAHPVFNFNYTHRIQSGFKKSYDVYVPHISFILPSTCRMKCLKQKVCHVKYKCG